MLAALTDFHAGLLLGIACALFGAVAGQLVTLALSRRRLAREMDAQPMQSAESYSSARLRNIKWRSGK